MVLAKVALSALPAAMPQPTGPSGVQPKNWLTPGVWITPARTASEAAVEASTAGLPPPSTTVWPSWVPTSEASATVPARRWRAGEPGQRPAGGRAERGGAGPQRDLPVQACRPASCPALRAADRRRRPHLGARIAIAIAGARSVSRLTSSSWRPLRAERPVAAAVEHAERDLAEVAADQDAQRVAYRGPHGPALDQGRDDRFEPVVGDHQVGGGPGGGGAALAERDADVGEPDGGGVVGAVAGHRHHPAGLLQRLDDPYLVRRRAPGDHVGTAQPLVERVVVELVEFDAGDDPLLGIVGADDRGDRRGGARMVAGDHDGVHPGLPDPGDRRRGAGPYPVGQGQAADEGQVGDVGVGHRVRRRPPARRPPAPAARPRRAGPSSPAVPPGRRRRAARRRRGYVAACTGAGSSPVRP